MNEIRYALRSLLKTPGFTLVVILTLALGIGANTGIFSVVNAVLLRSLPYPDPDRVVSFLWRYNAGVEAMDVSPPMFQFWKDQSRSFDGLVATSASTFTFVGESGAERVLGLLGTADLFKVLGIAPVVGRGFLPEECVPGGSHVTVLTYGLWQRAFGGKADAVGKQVVLNEQPYTVIGVLPPEFSFEPGTVDLVNPLQLRIDPRDHGMNYTMIGRLRAGVTMVQAQVETDTLYKVVYEQNKDNLPRDRSMQVGRLQDYLVADARPLLVTLLAAVGLVLLVACGNVVNLLLSRSSARQRDVALRAALGAGVPRLALQMLAESMILAVSGGLLGTALAYWGVRFLVALMPAQIPGLAKVGLDYRVLGFACAISLVIGGLFALIGTLRISKTDPASAIKASTGSGIDPFRSRLGNALIVSEVAFSVILLTGAALLIATFVNLRGIRLGFDTANIWAVQLPLNSKFSKTPAVAELDRSLIERIGAIPGVTSVTSAASIPQERGPNFIFGIEGQPPDKFTYVELRPVGPGYFRTLGIPLRAGRELNETDTENSTPVLVANETLARMLNGPQAALGHRLIIGRSTPQEDVPREIVGVVSNVADGQPGRRIFPTLYVARSQVGNFTGLSVSLLIRTAGSVEIAAQLRKAIQSVDPQLPLTKIRSMDEVASTAVAQQRFNMMLISLFAGTALLLTTIGLYGVLGYQVAQRTREIGLRMALGATRHGVLRMIVLRGLILTACGLIVGTAGALALTNFIKSMLFGVTPTSPLATSAVSGLLLIVASIASAIPAIRAMRVDPMTALRSE